MVREIKLRQVGGSVGATLPKAMADRLHLTVGDRVLAVETEQGILLTPLNQVRTHGGLAGLRDENALESALARPKQRWHYEPAVDLATLASRCGHGFCQNRPFRDGNKRVALVTMVESLRISCGPRLVMSKRREPLAERRSAPGCPSLTPRSLASGTPTASGRSAS